MTCRRMLNEVELKPSADVVRKCKEGKCYG
jgi:hypothetical protein